MSTNATNRRIMSIAGHVSCAGLSLSPTCEWKRSGARPARSASRKRQQQAANRSEDRLYDSSNRYLRRSRLIRQDLHAAINFASVADHEEGPAPVRLGSLAATGRDWPKLSRWLSPLASSCSGSAAGSVWKCTRGHCCARRILLQPFYALAKSGSLPFRYFRRRTSISISFPVSDSRNFQNVQPLV
jgi:hypothetical protein